MIEIKEIARLYPAQLGYTLVVGKMDHPLDVERTAAKKYYHLADDVGYVFVGNTMRDLRIAIERNEMTIVKDNIGIIDMVLTEREERGIVKTMSYTIDAEFKRATAIQ